MKLRSDATCNFQVGSKVGALNGNGLECLSWAAMDARRREPRLALSTALSQEAVYVDCPVRVEVIAAWQVVGQVSTSRPNDRKGRAGCVTSCELPASLTPR